MTAMKRRARSLEEPEPEEDDKPVTAAVLRDRAHAKWLKIRTEYITSIEAPTHDDLAKKYGITLDSVRQKSMLERWGDLREEWWNDVEVHLLTKIRDQYLQARLDDMVDIREVMKHLLKHAMPLKDKDGNVRVDADGLPIYAHDFKSQEGVLKALLELQERSMLLRGEAIMRTSSEITDRRKEVVEDADAQLADKTNFSSAEIRAIARELIRKRQEASQQEKDDGVIETEADEGDDSV